MEGQKEEIQHGGGHRNEIHRQCAEKLGKNHFRQGHRSGQQQLVGFQAQFIGEGFHRQNRHKENIGIDHGCEAV